MRDRYTGLQIISKERRSKVRDTPLNGNKDRRAMLEWTVMQERMPELCLIQPCCVRIRS